MFKFESDEVRFFELEASELLPRARVQLAQMKENPPKSPEILFTYC